MDDYHEVLQEKVDYWKDRAERAEGKLIELKLLIEEAKTIHDELFHDLIPWQTQGETGVLLSGRERLLKAIQGYLNGDETSLRRLGGGYTGGKNGEDKTKRNV
jgi:hypothetical protein